MAKLEEPALNYNIVHQSDNVALTFYLFSSSDAVERDRMHFTPKTYIARSIFALTCVTYKKLVPSMSWEVIEFLIIEQAHYFRYAILLFF